MTSSLPLISVIIPVYNTEAYLKQCVDSIINQTYRNLEIILVDDGSKDSSGHICDEYQSTDARVFVIHQENSGVAQARNAGIAAANGDYIMFVDSDDWIDKSMCMSLFEALSTYKVQSVMCSYIREYPGKSLEKVILPNNKVFSGSDFLRRLCGPVDEDLKHPENLECFNMMWGKLYPSEALKGILVTDIKQIGSSEDMLFNLEVFLNIDSIVYINQPFYHYRKNAGASISSSYKPNLETQWDNLYEKMRGIIVSNQLPDRYMTALNNRIAVSALGIGMNCVQDNAAVLVKCKRLKKALSHPNRSETLKQLKIKHMPIYWKLFYLSARYKFIFAFFTLLVIIKELKGKV